MAFRSTMFAVQSTQLDLQTLLTHVNEQYLEFLHKKGSSVNNVTPAILHGEDTEEQRYPGYRIVFIDADLMHHFHEFIKSHQVDVMKEESADGHRFSLTITKDSLAHAALTNQHAGEYLFSLNKYLQGLLQVSVNENKGMQP